MAERWEFWIDVGGTFTDVLARDPEGAVTSFKLLSSGIMKGRAADSSDSGCIIDPARTMEPDGFWNDYEVMVYGLEGEVIGTARVASSDGASGTLRLAEPVDALAAGHDYALHGGEEAPVLAIRYLLGLGLNAQVPPVRLKLGTTRGTNALLERKGVPSALVTTWGFGDVLEIGTQNRPDLFSLEIRKPSMLYRRVVALHERLDAQGNVLTPLDDEAVRVALQEVHDEGIDALAVCLLHSYRNPDHERRVAAIARDLGFGQVSVSSECSPLIKIVSRGDTTMVDAYLTPVIRDYIGSIRTALGSESEVQVMTSAGGLVDAANFVGKDSVLSGPAGGVVGYARAAEDVGHTRAIGFDMGGTSTDVSRYDGRFDTTFETEKAGVRIAAPALAIETVAAGGGSICDFDGQKLCVGPESAGAAPGPACYGAGGPLTVTDCNLILGRVPERHFPFALHRDRSLACLREIALLLREQTGRAWGVEELAEGFLTIANANMARPIYEISVARGYDVRDYVLVSFGGAGGQHACAIADVLSMRRILVHPHAGVLSAYGIGQADIRHFAERQVLHGFDAKTPESLAPDIEELEHEARRRVLADGVTDEQMESGETRVEMRYVGQDATIHIPVAPGSDWQADFEAEHRRLYGHIYPGRGLEVVALRVEAIGRMPRPTTRNKTGRDKDTPLCAVDKGNVWHGGKAHPAPLYEMEALRPGDAITGPAIVLDRSSTIVIDPEWTAHMLPEGELMMERAGEATDLLDAADAGVDPVTLELFNNRFATVSEQMGAVLRNTSFSTNIKERLDFSCAIFTGRGDLVVNAPHIPVHLGAMGETVRRVIASAGEIRPGDVFVCNDPYNGGSHLPDVTVVTPVHGEQEGTPLFFTASRAHHAEIGGVTPGSLYTDATCLEEEGVLIPVMRLVDAGEPRWQEMEKVLTTARYPSRAPGENLADLAAQVAANNTGVRLLLELVAHAGLDVVRAYMGHIREAASKAMRQAISKLPDGQHHFEDHLDNGACIRVCVKVHGETACVDFTGTDPVSPDNLNATPAIVTACILYGFRSLLERDIPLNEGVLEPIEVILPEGSLLSPPATQDPARRAAVAGGNVEVSQRVVDCLFGALGVVAASHGSMNNLVFGNDKFGYYETIGGGSGAGPGFHGASAVHTHMTNTRITDAEVLEQRYPVRLREFSIRRCSGGVGQYSGGDGVVREIEAVDPLELSVLTGRRGEYAAYGLQGGEAGRPGLNTLIRADGTEEDLGYRANRTLHPGDRLRLESAGGGGFGAADLTPR